MENFNTGNLTELCSNDLIYINGGGFWDTVANILATVVGAVLVLIGGAPAVIISGAILIWGGASGQIGDLLQTT
ncbi:hypothetical protein [Aquirufa ecclesiirivi]|uniref:hypothetical protein n=1 Tax=Aquirufa ecclesiirivi TaxID=2715124 RepID=UPI0022A88663|nr:hypothetical protein [Aquirufa ecclesiirivi]MCZ2473693.1 hypothetical protein [Aquirufa ecclesiirivi]